MDAKSSSSSVQSKSGSPNGEEVKSTGLTFRTKVIKIGAGEDILQKLISVCEIENSILQIVSAGGSLRRLSLIRENEIYKYEGCFSILTFNGFVHPPDTHRRLPMDWILQIVAAPGDGPLIGGRVSDTVEAATETIIVAWLYPPTAPLPRSSDQITPEDTSSSDSTTS